MMMTSYWPVVILYWWYWYYYSLLFYSDSVGELPPLMTSDISSQAGILPMILLFFGFPSIVCIGDIVILVHSFWYYTGRDIDTGQFLKTYFIDGIDDTGRKFCLILWPPVDDQILKSGGSDGDAIRLIHSSDWWSPLICWWWPRYSDLMMMTWWYLYSSNENSMW